MRTLLSFAFIFTCACAELPAPPPPPLESYRDADYRDCWSHAKVVEHMHLGSPLGPMGDPAQEQMIIDACMAQRGWK